MKVEKIITHKAPHLDEIMGLWLLQEFGQEKYPGVAIAKLEFCDSDNNLPKERDNLILLGIGGGKFDEHARNGKEANGDCVATLVAKDLGIYDDPALAQIFKFVKNVDQKGASHPFDISSVIKDMHLLYPDNPEMVISWAMQALNAKYRAQAEFFGAKQELEKATIEKIYVGDNAIIIVVAESDNKQFAKFARSSLGANAGIVIQKNSSGNVQIFTDKKLVRIDDVVPMMRVEEQRAQNKMLVTDWNILASDGVLDDIPEWYYHQEGQMLLNGSLTKSGVPATKISLDRIVEIIKQGIDPDYFPDECWGWCIKRECEFYAYGLSRCRKTRVKNYKKR